MKLSKLFQFAIISSFCVSCEECGIKSEPTLSVRFSPFNPKIEIVSVRAIGQIKDIPKDIRSDFSVGEINLPVNLNAKQTTYIFEQASNRTDTLTVYYEPTLVYQSRGCGYTMELLKPSNVHSKSTFKRVEVEYGRYYKKITGLTDSEGGEGLSVTIYTQ
jgi:Family of unknown function (DUF6452)